MLHLQAIGAKTLPNPLQTMAFPYSFRDLRPQPLDQRAFAFRRLVSQVLHGALQILAILSNSHISPPPIVGNRHNLSNKEQQIATSSNTVMQHLATNSNIEQQSRTLRASSRGQSRRPILPPQTTQTPQFEHKEGGLQLWLLLDLTFIRRTR